LDWQKVERTIVGILKIIRPFTMTQKIKKIIAREVIIFTIYLLVTSGTLFVIWLNNYNKSKLKDEFIEVRNKLYDQQFAIVDKVKHQNEGDLRAFIKPKRRIPSLEELEGKPKSSRFIHSPYSKRIYV
jgi:hypothetical protein